MKATTFFNKDEKAPESGGEAVIESGKLYILTDSGVIVKQRVALRQSQSKQDQKLITKLHHIAKTEQTLLPSFYVDDDEYVLYAKTGVITHYPLHLREIQSVFWDLRNAIKALHDEGIAHLDIKPSNIVLRDNGLPALIDYGCSGFLNDKTVGDTTLLYAPPEYFGDQKQYNREAHDIWSMAMSILELAVPEQFSKFKSKIPSNLLGQAAFFEKYYSQENLSTTFAPMLFELREKNERFATLIEPLLNHNPAARIKNFRKLPEIETKKIATVQPLPQHNEAALRIFIKQTNLRIQHLKHLQIHYTQGSSCYQRIDYQITVNRDQREKAYLELGKTKASEIPHIGSKENWDPNITTKELNELIIRFDAASDQEKPRIVFKIIRAADMWLFDNPNSPQRKAVQLIMTNSIKIAHDYSKGLQFESFSEYIPRSG